MRIELPVILQQQLDSLLLKIQPQAPSSAPTTSEVKIPAITHALQQFMATMNATPKTAQTPQLPLPQRLIKEFLTAHLNPITPENLREKLESREPLTSTGFMLQEPESWPIIVLPFVMGKTEQWMTIRYYREPKKEQPESEALFHFEVSLDVPHWGPVHFTGRHRTGFLGLSIKMTQELPRALQEEIKALFYISIKGEIVFDIVKELVPSYNRSSVIYA